MHCGPPEVAEVLALVRPRNGAVQHASVVPNDCNHQRRAKTGVPKALLTEVSGLLPIDLECVPVESAIRFK